MYCSISKRCILSCISLFTSWQRMTVHWWVKRLTADDGCKAWGTCWTKSICCLLDHLTWLGDVGIAWHLAFVAWSAKALGRQFVSECCRTFLNISDVFQYVHWECQKSSEIHTRSDQEKPLRTNGTILCSMCSIMKQFPQEHVSFSSYNVLFDGSRLCRRSLAMNVQWNGNAVLFQMSSMLLSSMTRAGAVGFMLRFGKKGGVQGTKAFLKLIKFLYCKLL